jgi:hypothetical protein
MKKSLSRSAVSVSAWMLASAALSGLTGCVQDPPMFDAHAAQLWEKRTETEIRAKPMYPLPTTGVTPYIPGETPDVPEARLQRMAVPEGPEVKMSLQDVIHRAILNNMEIRVASFDTAIDQTRILEAEANFDPTAFWDASSERIDKLTPGSLGNVINPRTNQITSRVTNFDQEQLANVDFGIRQNLPAGGKAEIKEEIANVWSNPPRGLLRSFYQNDFVLTVNQPLLQKFCIEVYRARITKAPNN